MLKFGPMLDFFSGGSKLDVWLFDSEKLRFKEE